MMGHMPGERIMTLVKRLLLATADTKAMSLQRISMINICYTPASIVFVLGPQYKLLTRSQQQVGHRYLR